MDRMTTAIDGTDRRTPDRYIRPCIAYYAGNVFKFDTFRQHHVSHSLGLFLQMLHVTWCFCVPVYLSDDDRKPRKNG